MIAELSDISSHGDEHDENADNSSYASDDVSVDAEVVSRMYVPTSVPTPEHYSVLNALHPSLALQTVFYEPSASFFRGTKGVA